MAIDTIRREYAIWAAATAARSSPRSRFTVEQAREILMALNIPTDPDALPEPSDFDRSHDCWCRAAMERAETVGVGGFSYGVAAKLINIYLKSLFVIGGHHDHPKVAPLHPPIDSLLLNALAKANVGGFAKEWRVAKSARWSKLDATAYTGIIALLKRVFLRPWEAEAFWSVGR